MATKANDNPLGAALSGGKARRQNAGERVGPGSLTEDEVKLTVELPESLHRELKAGAALSGQSMKEILIRGVRAELAKLKP